MKVVFLLISLFLLLQQLPEVLSQARAGLTGKLRRRHGMVTDIYGRPRKISRRRPDDPRMPEYSFRRDMTRPGNPYWRLGAMPGNSFSDRFRSHPDGFAYDYFHGR